MNRLWRGRCAAVVNLLILAPMVPFGLLQAGAHGLADFLDWMWDDRWLARKMIAATERVDRAFGVDADSDFKEWHERMAKRRILTQKESASAEMTE